MAVRVKKEKGMTQVLGVKGLHGFFRRQGGERLVHSQRS